MKAMNTADTELVAENDRLKAREAALLAALKAMVRCPGVHQTDQVTGNTFARLILSAIGKDCRASVDTSF